MTLSPGENYSSSSWESAAAMEIAVGSMEMAPGAIPRPGRVPKQRLLSPESCFGNGGRDGTFPGWRPIHLGFSRREATYKRKGEGGGRPRAPHHP